MTVPISYPGVYIEEIPSGVRTITGVPTSVAAFIGRALRGPVNDPQVINSFGDFERTFGGLAVDCPMSYAVNDFFVNGGGQAVIVRLWVAPAGAGAGATGAATLSPGGLNLVAATPGEWGNKLKVTVDDPGVTPDFAHEIDPTFTPADLFNLTIEDTAPRGRKEVIRNLTVKDGPRRVDRALAAQSSLVRLVMPVPAAVPAYAATATGATGANSAPLAGAADFTGVELDKTGMYALLKADIFNLLCIPPDTRGGDTPVPVYQAANQFCAEHRAMLLVDPSAAWSSNPVPAGMGAAELTALGISGPWARNAALYFPRVIESDPLHKGQLDTFVPCGLVAGVMARTDAERGVWKAPAGLDAALVGIQGLEANLSDAENGQLNPLGINCLRSFSILGRVVWGARTLRGADQFGDEYKYVPVRRLALFLEETLYRGTKWVVFEPNDEPLWAQIRLNIGAFMHNLFRQGAFEGGSPKDAYFVKCDKETTTQNDIDLGIVNIVVGFAPLKPAEFVIIQIQQIAGQIAV
jgi:Bacteriophage tail sheath protein